MAVGSQETRRRAAKGLSRSGQAVLAVLLLGACVSEPRHTFLPLADSPYAAVMPECDPNPEIVANVTSSSFALINPEVRWNLTRGYGVDSITSTRQTCPSFGVVIEEFQSTNLAKQYLDGHREAIGFAEYEDVRALDWPANWNYAVSVDPWNYAEDGTVTVADYAIVQVVVQVGKVTLEYSTYIAHDFSQIQKEVFVSGLGAFHDKARELVQHLELSRP